MGETTPSFTPGLIVETGGKITAVALSAKIPTARRSLILVTPRCSQASSMPHSLTFPTPTTTSSSGSNNLQKTVADARPRTPASTPGVTLMAGFTTVRDVGSSDYLDVRPPANGIRNGDVPGPVCSSTVHASAPPVVTAIMRTDIAREFSATNQALVDGVINGPDQARYAVRLDHKYGADMIKVCASGGVLSSPDDVDTPAV